jgi:hypothetical protein
MFIEHSLAKSGVDMEPLISYYLSSRLKTHGTVFKDDVGEIDGGKGKAI